MVSQSSLPLPPPADVYCRRFTLLRRFSSPLSRQIPTCCNHLGPQPGAFLSTLLVPLIWDAKSWRLTLVYVLLSATGVLFGLLLLASFPPSPCFAEVRRTENCRRCGSREYDLMMIGARTASAVVARRYGEQRSVQRLESQQCLLQSARANCLRRADCSPLQTHQSDQSPSRHGS